MTTHSSIWLLNKLCSRKSYSFTSTGMVIAWMSSSSCPTKSIKQLYSITRQENTTAHRSTLSCFGKMIISPTPLRLPSWWNLLGQRNIPQWKCSQLEDEWEVPPSYLHHRHHLFFPSLLVQIQRYKVEELDGWLDWHTLYIPTISVSPEKNWSCTRWWRSRWSWHTRVCYSTIRKV